MKKIALITELIGPQLSPGDSKLVDPLQKLGVHAEPVPWDDPGADWGEYDALVLRSCWHYPEHPERFRDWIRELAERRIQLWNPATIVSWNMDKRYLLELERMGIPIVPTVWLDGSSPPDLEGIMQENGWTEAVVKPRISTGSDNTWRVTWPPAEEDQARIVIMTGEHDLMVQKLIPEIADGEWSLIFIEGGFSHAVLKRPGAGQIFVQEHLGGMVMGAAASEMMIDQAAQVLSFAEKLVGQGTLYARVDGLLIEGDFTLMELELIEPSLYMRRHPATVERFADAIAQKVLSNGMLL